MASAITDFAANHMLEVGPLTDLTLFMAPHTGQPGNAGASEITGGSPATARQAVTVDVTGRVLTVNNIPIDFDIPGGVTVNHLALWDALVAGNCIAWDDVVPEAFAGQGVYTAEAFTVTV